VAFKNRLPIKEIAGVAPWHGELTNTLPILHKDFPPNLNDAVEFIKSRDATPGQDSDTVIPRSALRQQTEAAEMIALDLVLSSAVFAPPDYGTSGSAPRNVPGVDTSGLEGATAALSLTPAGPPPFLFNHLRPTRRSLIDSDDDDEYEDPSSNKAIVPAGVQFLLNEWKLGEDPTTYVYNDPYSNEDPEDVDSSNIGKGKMRGKDDWDNQLHPSPPLTQAPPTILVKPRAPPAILSSSQPPRRPTVRFSSPVFTRQPNAFPATQPTFSQASQETDAYLPSTQQVPGRFGGKLASGKKPIKRRMGGF
jgi:hypothetical protein